MTAAAAAKEGGATNPSSPAVGNDGGGGEATEKLGDDMTFLCDAFRISRGVRRALWAFDARTLEDFSLMTTDDFREMIVDATRKGLQIPPLQQRKLSVLLEWARRLAEEHQERREDRQDRGEEREEGSSSRPEGQSGGGGTGRGTTGTLGDEVVTAFPLESRKTSYGRNSSVYFDAIAVSGDDQSEERGGDRRGGEVLPPGEDAKTVTFDDVFGGGNGAKESATNNGIVNNDKSTAAASFNHPLLDGADTATTASTIPPDWRERFLADLPALKRRLREVGETQVWSLCTGTVINIRWLFCGVGH